MWIRVARFEGGSTEALEAETANTQRQLAEARSEGPPPGLEGVKRVDCGDRARPKGEATTSPPSPLRVPSKPSPRRSALLTAPVSTARVMGKGDAG
jgi:hypothetical protein